MCKSFELRNVGRGQVAFMLYPPVDPAAAEGLPKHKRRKLSREAVRSVVIPPAQSVDLVKLTGLSVEVLESLPELRSILANVNVQRMEEPVAEESEPEADASKADVGDDESGDSLEGTDEPKADPVEDAEKPKADPEKDTTFSTDLTEEDLAVNLDPTPPDKRYTKGDLYKLTKASIVDVGKKFGLELSRGDLQGDLIDAVLKAQG